MKALVSFILVFASCMMPVQGVSLLVKYTNGEIRLFEAKAEFPEISASIYQHVARYNLPADSLAEKFRTENQILATNDSSVVLSSGDTMFLNFFVGAAFESPGEIIINGNGNLNIYSNPPGPSPLFEIPGFDGDPEAIFANITSTDTVLAFSADTGIFDFIVSDFVTGKTFIGPTYNSPQGEEVVDIWFTDLTRSSLFDPSDIASINNSLSTDTFVTVGDWDIRVTAADSAAMYDTCTTNYLMSYENFFGQNRLRKENDVSLPQVVISKKDSSLLRDLAFVTHIDAAGSGGISKVGVGLGFSILPGSKKIWVQSLGTQLDDTPTGSAENYRLRALQYLTLNTGTVIVRSRGDLGLPFGSGVGNEVLNPKTMVPEFELSMLQGRQTDFFGPGNNWQIELDYEDQYTTEEGLLFTYGVPVIRDIRSQSVLFSFDQTHMRPISGYNCAYEAQSEPPYFDVKHDNGQAGACFNDTLSCTKGMIIKSSRNARVDTVNHGIFFYEFDLSTQTGIFLDTMSYAFNAIAGLEGQHHPRFLNPTFQNNSNVFSLWSNSHPGCSYRLAELLIVEMDYFGPKNFNFTIHRHPLGLSGALGNNILKRMGQDIIGLANGGGDPGNSLSGPYLHAALYKTDTTFEQIEVIASIYSENKTYYMDFTAREDGLPNLVVDFDVELSSDSSTVAITALDLPADGMWYWQGSLLPADSTVVMTVEEALADEHGDIYVTGTFDGDTIRVDWSNAILSQPFNLKRMVEQMLPPTSVEEVVVETPASVRTYPNPYKDSFVLTSSESLGTVRIFTIDGRLVREFKTSESLAILEFDRPGVVIRSQSQGGLTNVVIQQH